MQNAFIGVMVMAVLRMFIKRQWLVVVLVTLFFTVVSNRGGTITPFFWVELALSALLSLGIMLSLVRFGLLATCVTFFVYLTTSGLALTLDSSRQYASSSMWLLALMAGLLVIGYWWSRADEPLFASPSRPEV